MRLSRSQITTMLALLMAMIMGGNALAQRYSYYSQQQMQRQQQMQQQQQQQQMQMQRQQEQMRRQQEQARQQQAAIRQQQADQQRIMRMRQQEAQRIMQKQRDQAMQQQQQQQQLALERQRLAASQRVESESRKAAKDQVLAKQQAVDRSALKQQGLEKNRQERLLRLKQDFLQKQRVTSGKANIPQPARVLTLSEKFQASSRAKNIATYQPGKQLTTKELAAQRQAVQLLAKKVKAKAVTAGGKEKKYNSVLKQINRCGFKSLSKVSESASFLYDTCLGGASRKEINSQLRYLEEPQFNPAGTVGAARAWTKKSRIKYVELPTTGKIRYVPPKEYSSSNPLPRGPGNGYLDRFGNEWKKGPSRTAGQAFEWDVQLSKNGRSKLGWASRDGTHLNVSLDGRVTHK